MAHSWTIRGLQLDLARQMEPLSRIRELIDLSVECGLTHMQLYLEGRVRLPCFPGPLDGGFYSVEELTRIAEYAHLRGLQIVPVVAGLAHAEHIVTRPEYAHLAEEREGRGRFHPGPATLCPSLAGTREFLTAFCQQLCAIFPGSELHLGCDEPWNLGYCSLCNQRAQADGLGHVYTEHLQWLHQLAKSLGRRLWLWDDFLEVFPKAIDHLPRDICWSHWNYDEVIDPQGTQAHFTNRRRHRWLEQYTRLGIEAVVVPWALVPRNVESLLEHGHRHPSVIGSILSEWEMAWRSWDERRTVVRAFAALCRQEPPETAWDNAITAEAPGLTTSQALIAKATIRQLRDHVPQTLNAYLRGPLSPSQHDRIALNTLALASLPPADAGLLHGIRITAELDQMMLGLQQWLSRAYDPKLPPTERQRVDHELHQLTQLCQRLGPAEDRHLRQQRPNCLPHASIASTLKKLEAVIQQAREHLGCPHPASALFILRTVLPDGHGAPLLRISLYEDDAWREIYAGSPKPDPRSPGSYTTHMAIFRTSRPQRLRISAGGYGGIAVCWCEIVTVTERWVPCQILNHEGPVDQPERILSDDSWYCRFGDEDIQAQLLNVPHAPRLGTVECLLTPAG